MFSHLIGKPLKRYDISVFENYPPEAILEYHHHRDLEIEFQTYRLLKEKASCQESENPVVASWVSFFDEVLKAKEDLEMNLDNSFLPVLGPYYYPRTNTTVFFTSYTPAAECVNATDLQYLCSLAEPPLPNDKVVKHYQSIKKLT
ncbi:MAG: hypothetical protein HPY90_09770 [Syntrophothermus sp.]|uniref:hypothetical protein n=1 Tax=Syntrophothermus sp. TaxID=2736299 RepID=UPI00257A1786|nr:hypothetical protein [Syntrophothermus sp.]NSW83541.1 hypothetical protein [Syntrophothermus sp.]